MRLPIGSPVTLAVKTIDRYGRTMAEVSGEINLGLALVEDGKAFAMGCGGCLEGSTGPGNPGEGAAERCPADPAGRR